MTVSKILIAVDRTAAAFKAVKVGFSLAKSLKKTEVLLIQSAKNYQADILVLGVH